MALQTTIIQQIETTVQGKYGGWRIGITADPQKERARFGNPLDWLHWQADTDAAATAVRTHFIGLGMQGAGEPENKGTYVYIFC